MSPIETLVTGMAGELVNPTVLRAGPLTLQYADADLRYLCLDGEELLRRIYVAVRDDSWNTVPGEVSGLSVHSEAASFTIRLQVEHRQGDIGFVWQGVIEGDRSGSIRFEMEGEALSTFNTNRVGCCVLFPAAFAGRHCRIAHSATEFVDGCLPASIEPAQPIEGFHDVRSIRIPTSGERWIDVRCEGDTFEVEDQRNWLDASFKLYSRPLQAPAPYRLERGERVRQTVFVRLIDESGDSVGGPAARIGHTDRRWHQTSTRGTGSRPVRIDVDTSSVLRVPSLGTAAPVGPGLSQLVRSRLQRLQLSHMRVDLDAANSSSLEHAAAQLKLCATLGVPVELALHLPAGPHSDTGWRDLVSRTGIRRILVHEQGSPCTPRRAVELAQSAACRQAVVGFGTRGDFFDLNVARPEFNEAAFVFWSMTPQWHATDHLSKAETPETVGDQVRSMRSLFPGVPHVISPITLRPRLCTETGGWSTDDGPGQEYCTDPRQQSLAGAAWTLAMISQLTRGGARAATFYECLGPRGIMPLDAMHAATCGLTPTVFPIYLVLAALAGYSDALLSMSSDPSSVAALLLDNDGQRRVLIANLRNEPRDVEIHGPFNQPMLHRLDETNVASRVQQPESFGASAGEAMRASDDCIRLRLERFGIAQIDDVP